MKSEKKENKGTIEAHLKIREAQKKKRPAFVRQCAHKKKRVSMVWRYPTGIHSKLRHQRTGHIPIVNPGWRTPVDVRGKHNSGLEMIMVANPLQLEKINKETEGIIISSAVGTKKRIAIIEEAKKKGISVLNLDADKYVEEAKKELSERIANNKKSINERKEKTKKREEKEAPKEEKKSEISDEEKKKEERKEIEKVLISKE
jgi:large subunit ribosomal protein L32e